MQTIRLLKPLLDYDVGKIIKYDGDHFYNEYNNELNHDYYTILFRIFTKYTGTYEKEGYIELIDDVEEKGVKKLNVNCSGPKAVEKINEIIDFINNK